MELELKHLAPYMPYKLQLQYHNQKIGILNRLSDTNEYDDIKISIDYGELEHIWMFKPILKPMSDLQTEYWQSAAKEEARNNQDEYSVNHKTHVNNISVGFYFWLIEHHFDVFGLITTGLAIDINTL